MAKTIVQYIRRSKTNRERVGVMVAKFDELTGVIRIGYSKCNKKDQYSNEVGKTLAEERIRCGRSHKVESLPHAVQRELKAFITRCKTYYKSESVIF